MSNNPRKESLILESAVSQFLSESFAYGDVVSHLWLEVYLEIPKPETLSDAQRTRFLMLSRVEDFKRLLLEEHKLALESVRGEGYRIVPPKDQAAFAVTEAARLIQKGIDRGLVLLQHARLGEMNDDARKRHIDAHIKMSGLQSLTQRERRDVFALFDQQSTAQGRRGG